MNTTICGGYDNIERGWEKGVPGDETEEAQIACGAPRWDASGAYRLPTGGYVIKPVGRVTANGRRIYVQGVQRDEPDVQSLARAFLRLAEDFAEQEHRTDDSDLLAA